MKTSNDSMTGSPRADDVLPTGAARAPARRRRFVSWPVFAALLLCAWLLWPALTATHVEGFSAQIQSLALVLWQQGSIAGHDLTRPLVSEFIFLTRPGVVDLLALSNASFGYTGETGFRVLTVASLAAMLLASARFAVRHGGVPFGIALFVCVLTPGLVELGFYFNDNVVSAAFAALALTAVSLRRATLSAALAGVLIGCAVLCRIDAVLALPLLLLVFLLRQQTGRAAAGRLVLMAVMALAVHVIAARYNGGDLRDALQVTRLFTAQHLTGHGRLPGKTSILFFMGAIVPVLLVVGCKVFWRSRPAGWRGWTWIFAFYGYPLLLLLYVLRTTIEIRYFLPLLAPVLTTIAGRGWMALADGWRSNRPARRRWARGLAIAAALVLLAPPALPVFRDGPRVLIGRFWSPVIWHRWQVSVQEGLATMRQVVARTTAVPVSTVLSTHWNDEFYLRLQLFEAGFHEVDAGPACRPLSRYENGSKVVWQVRIQPEYALPPFDSDLAAAVMLAAVRRCTPLQRSSLIEATSFGPVREESLHNGIRESDIPGATAEVLGHALEERLSSHAALKLVYERINAAPLTPQRLQEIGSVAAARLHDGEGKLGLDEDTMLDRYEASFRRH